MTEVTACMHALEKEIIFNMVGILLLLILLVLITGTYC